MFLNSQSTISSFPHFSVSSISLCITQLLSLFVKFMFCFWIHEHLLTIHQDRQQNYFIYLFFFHSAYITSLMYAKYHPYVFLLLFTILIRLDSLDDFVSFGLSPWETGFLTHCVFTAQIEKKRKTYSPQHFKLLFARETSQISSCK